MSKTIKAWVNGVVENIEVNEITTYIEESTLEDRVVSLENKGTTISTVTLLADSWTGDSAPYSQEVVISGVTINSKVDLQPTAEQTKELQDEDIAFVAENNDGIVTIYAINGKPIIDYTIQVQLTEVTSV